MLFCWHPALSFYGGRKSMKIDWSVTNTAIYGVKNAKEENIDTVLSDNPYV